MYNDILKLFYERNEYKHFFIGSRKLELFVSLAHKSHSMIKVLFRPKKKKKGIALSTTVDFCSRARPEIYSPDSPK